MAQHTIDIKVYKETDANDRNTDNSSFGTNLINGGEGRGGCNKYNGSETDATVVYFNKSNFSSLDLSAVNSVTLHYSAKCDKNSSKRYGRISYFTRVGDTSVYRMPSGSAKSYTSWSENLPTSYTGYSGSGGSFTVNDVKNNDICAGIRVNNHNDYIWNDTKTYVKNVYIRVVYTLYDYTLSVTSDGNGTVSGGGTYEKGKSVTLTATPNSGYTFKQWSDGNTSASRTITINGDATYTAVFERTTHYLSFDSIFNFKYWKDSGITSGNSVTISNLTDTSVTVESNNSANDGYTAESPLFSVSEGTSYTINADITGSEYEIFISFYHAGSWSSLNLTASLPYTFTVPYGIDKISIKLGARAYGNSVTFSNIRIYPSNYSYMDNTLNSSERYLRSTDTFLLPTPTRKGFNFEGWFTQPEGGTKTNITSVPYGYTILYSQWTESTTTPKFTSIKLPNVKENTVNADEYFIIQATLK